MATNQPVQTREPIFFAIGDTLVFQRSLPDYLPSNGWQIQYSLSQPTPNGAKLVFQFTTVPDATNQYHTVDILNFGAGLDAGDYVLSGQVVCSPTGEAPNQKQTIYYGELDLDPDLADGLAAANVQTFVQQMIPILEAKIKRLESYDLTETDIQRSRMVVEDKNKTYERYWRLLEFRGWEKKVQACTNTGQRQDQIIPVFGGGW